MNDDIIYGLSEISLYLSNIGENDFAKTIEDACKKLEQLKERISFLEERLRLLEYGDQDTLQNSLMPAT